MDRKFLIGPAWEERNTAIPAVQQPCCECSSIISIGSGNLERAAKEGLSFICGQCFLEQAIAELAKGEDVEIRGWMHNGKTSLERAQDN